MNETHLRNNDHSKRSRVFARMCFTRCRSESVTWEAHCPLNCTYANLGTCSDSSEANQLQK